MIKVLIHHENIIILNVNALNNSNSECMKPKLVETQGNRQATKMLRLKYPSLDN